MAPRKKTGGGGGGDKDLQTEEPLQAVILADSFNTRFRPLTLERPRALLPLVNECILDYSIEFLAKNNVKEIFVFCCSHARLIEQYLLNSKWNETTADVQVHVIISETVFSAGDALREIDRHGVIRTDFVLLSGDVISNMNLEPALQQHRQRVAAAKGSTIMTMVFKQAAVEHKRSFLHDDTLLVMDPSSQRLLHLGSDKTPNVDLDMFSDGRLVVQVRDDLFDCRIDICSPGVLLEFADNFDYADVRHDYVRGVLTSDEVVDSEIYVHAISGEYAARVRNLPLYHQVSQDIIRRWVHPMVPDNNMLSETSSYHFKRGNVYTEDGVQVRRSTKIPGNVVLGRGTTVGEHSRISNSVLGANCVIGSGVTIRDSYLHAGVVVADNCTIMCSILADGVRVHADSAVNQCVLSYGTAIGPDITLLPLTKLTLQPPAEHHVDTRRDDDTGFGFAGDAGTDAMSGSGISGISSLGEDVTDGPAAAVAAPTPLTPASPTWNTAVVGQQGAGYVWLRDGDDANDDPRNVIGVPPSDAARDDNEGGSDAHGDGEESGDGESFWDSDDSDADGTIGDGDDEQGRWQREVYETVQHSLATGGNTGKMMDEIRLQTHSLKLTHERTLSECASALTIAFLDVVAEQNLQGKALAKALKKTLKTWAPLITEFCNVQPAEVDLIRVLQLYAEDHADFRLAFQFILQLLYDLDVLSEEAIREWHAKVGMEEDGEQWASLVQDLIQWFDTADSDDEDE